MAKLSVIIITKNEENAIGDCLESVKWAHELIVVDSGSTDRTIEICKSYGAIVSIEKDWPGFGKQKNRALNLATNEWVLSIDADERVTPQLRDEILNAIGKPATNVAFRIPRKSSFCGQFINHSGWWPDFVLRLFPRTDAKFSDDLVHERVLFNGKIKSLEEPFIHISHNDLDEVLNKSNRYSSDSAAMLLAKGQTSSLSKAILHGVWAFIRTYFLRRGFLDGRIGLILAIATAETTYYRYLKLMMMSLKK